MNLFLLVVSSFLGFAFTYIVAFINDANSPVEMSLSMVILLFLTSSLLIFYLSLFFIVGPIAFAG